MYSLGSYYVGPIGEKTIEKMIGNLKKWCPDHKPI